MRTARAQPLTELRDKWLGRRQAARTQCTFGTTVNDQYFGMRGFPVLSQAIIVNSSGQAYRNAAIVANRDFRATRRRRRAVIAG